MIKWVAPAEAMYATCCKQWQMWSSCKFLQKNFSSPNLHQLSMQCCSPRTEQDRPRGLTSKEAMEFWLDLATGNQFLLQKKLSKSQKASLLFKLVAEYITYLTPSLLHQRLCVCVCVRDPDLVKHFRSNVKIRNEFSIWMNFNTFSCIDWSKSLGFLKYLPCFYFKRRLRPTSGEGATPGRLFSFTFEEG